MQIRRDGMPTFAPRHGGETSAIEPLVREPFDSERPEAWLQALVDRAPALLPVADVDERVELPLYSLGREVPTDAGPIDNLFISANGHVVLVETKLFRNPEARRRVVAQILDYGAHVRTWTYSKLDAISAPRRPKGESLFTAARAGDVDEARWIDRVNENLATGRMTLLVVGDGIRTEVETLASALDGHAGFHFRLALVELRVFAVDADRVLVVPSTLLRTHEVERAIVTVRHEGAAASKVTVEAPVTAGPSSKRSALSEEAFYASLRDRPDRDDYAHVVRRVLALLDAPLRTEWTPNGFLIKALDPLGSGALISLFAFPLVINPYAAPRWWIEDKLRTLWHDDGVGKALADAHIEAMKKLGARVTKKEEVSFESTTLRGREDAFVAALEHTAAAIGAASRGREV